MASTTRTRATPAARFRPAFDFSPLRVRSFRLLVTGQTVSELGNSFQVVALPLLIFARGGSVAQIGLVVAAAGLGRLLTTPVAGLLVDRYGAWRIMMISDTGRILCTAGLTVVAATRGSIIAIGALAGLVGLLAGLFMPAEWAVMPSVLPSDQLHAGNSLNTTATYAAGLIGPSIAGLVVVFANPATALGVDSATFAVSAASLLAIGKTRPAASVTGTGTGTAKRASGGSGPASFFALLRSSPLLRNVLVVTVLANLSIGGLARVALPALAIDQFKVNAEGLGGLIAAFAAGSLAGGLIAAGFARVKYRGRGAMLSGLVLAAAITCVPLLGFAGALVMLFIAGLAATITNVLVVTTIQKGTPPELLGRTMSALMLCGVGLFPVSVAVVGFLIDAYGSRSFFFITGVTLVCGFSFGLSRRAIRTARDVDDSAAAEVEGLGA